MAVMRPSWFAYRQGKVEEVSPALLKLTGPNLRESYIGIRPGEHGRFSAFVRHTPDGLDVVATGPDHATENDAWEAAFEIYRSAEII
jgi:hypothetical protein